MRQKTPSYGDLSAAYGKPHVYLILANEGIQIRHLMPPLTKRGELERALLYAKVTKVVSVEVFGYMAFITVKVSERWWERASQPPSPHKF